MKLCKSIDSQGVRTYGIIHNTRGIYMLIAKADGRWNIRWVNLSRFGFWSGTKRQSAYWYRLWMPWIMVGYFKLKEK